MSPAGGGCPAPPRLHSGAPRSAGPVRGGEGEGAAPGGVVERVAGGCAGGSGRPVEPGAACRSQPGGCPACPGCPLSKPPGFRCLLELGNVRSLNQPVKELSVLDDVKFLGLEEGGGAFGIHLHAHVSVWCCTGLWKQLHFRGID